MKAGYSLLLSEYVKAEDLTHKDCKSFQIVCVACKEPIFKCLLREGKRGEATHYLSHYNKDKSYAAECEFRVGGLGKEEVEKANAEARGQKLRYFLSVLRESLIRHVYEGGVQSPQAKAFMDAILTNPRLREFREKFLGSCRAAPGAIITESLGGYVLDVEQTTAALGPLTTFSINTQKRIASDIWAHLMTRQARDNFFFLFACGWTILLSRLEIRTKADLGGPVDGVPSQYLSAWWQAEQKLCYALARLPWTTAGTECYDLLSELAEEQFPPVGRLGEPGLAEPASILLRMVSEIQHEMMGLLLYLPYFEMLREAQLERGEKLPSFPLAPPEERGEGNAGE